MILTAHAFTIHTDSQETSDSDDNYDYLISVIFPVYRREYLIARSFHSCIEDQLIDKYKIPIQLVAIDDCSPDNSYSDLKSLKTYYDNNSTLNKYVHIDISTLERNHGTLYVRLKALTQVRGKYVMSVDPDDELLPGMMYRLLQLTKNRDDIDIIQFRLLKVTNHRVKEMNSGDVKVMIYGEYPFPRLKFLKLTEPLRTYKYHLWRENMEGIDIDALNTSHRFNSSQIREMMHRSKLMWNLPGLFIKSKVMRKGVRFLNLDIESMSNITGYEDKLIAYSTFYQAKVLYFVDEIGYFYYRGVPRIKHWRTPRLSEVFNDFQKRINIEL